MRVNLLAAATPPAQGRNAGKTEWGKGKEGQYLWRCNYLANTTIFEETEKEKSRYMWHCVYLDNNRNNNKTEKKRKGLILITLHSSSWQHFSCHLFLSLSSPLFHVTCLPLSTPLSFTFPASFFSFCHHFTLHFSFPLPPPLAFHFPHLRFSPHQVFSGAVGHEKILTFCKTERE